MIADDLKAGYNQTTFQERSAGMAWAWTMAFGVVAIAGGVLAFMYPAVTLASLMGIISGFALIGGVLLFMGAGKMQSFQQTASRAI
jgi:uncharacterized membrane protein HdeD (DUF308 family)